MPDLGRFTAVDPLHWKFPYNSTYAFQENKLGMGRELEGLELFPFEFLLTSNSAIEPAIPLAEAGIKEIPIEEITLTGSKAAPPSPPGFWEKIGNWFDSVFDSSSESSAPRTNVKPESATETESKPYSESSEKSPNLNNLRRSAVRKAWKEEKDLVESGKDGTRRWTTSQSKELKEKGKVEGMKGHHINNVKDHPEMAGDPDNIEFVTPKEHLQRHNGNFRNKTTGELKNRKIID